LTLKKAPFMDFKHLQTSSNIFKPSAKSQKTWCRYFW
jgi:hypothetical protein